MTDSVESPSLIVGWVVESTESKKQQYNRKCTADRIQ